MEASGTDDEYPSVMFEGSEYYQIVSRTRSVQFSRTVTRSCSARGVHTPPEISSLTQSATPLRLRGRSVPPIHRGAVVDVKDLDRATVEINAIDHAVGAPPCAQAT